jgi:hypothetical protein
MAAILKFLIVRRTVATVSVAASVRMLIDIGDPD